MILKTGSKGNEVKLLQKILGQKGFYGGKIDGVYGDLTTAAVTEFQRQEGVRVDGIAGPRTLAAIGMSEALRNEGGEPIALTMEDKLHIAKIISRFEGTYTSCNKDWEFEGWFDNPRTDKAGNKLHPSERAKQPQWKPLGWSKYGKDPGHVGLSFGFVQFTQDGGNLGVLLNKVYKKNTEKFKTIFGDHWEKLLEVTNLRGEKKVVNDASSPTGKARRSPRVQPIGGHELWQEYWTEKFEKAGNDAEFQEAQREAAIELYFDPMIRKSAIPYNITSQKGLAILFDRSVQMGTSGCRSLMDSYLASKKEWSEEEKFDYLYRKVQDRGWSHRLRKLIDSREELSYYEMFILTKEEGV